MGCGSSKDQGPQRAHHTAGSRSHGDQRRNQNIGHHVPNPPPIPPPPPPPPPPSSMPPRAGGRRSNGQSDIQGIELRRVGRPNSNGVEGQHAHKRPLPVDILEAVQAVAACLNSINVKYAIVGGAGLVALGAGRVTDDVDFVVHPPAQLKVAKNELRKDPRFSIDPKTRHTKFIASSGNEVDIEALSYPGTFKGRFDQSTQLMTVLNRVCILNAPLYLESKCGSLPQRSADRKRDTDAQDINFILKFMVHSGIRARPSEVPSATQAFITEFDKENPGSRALFHQIGVI